MTSVKGVRLCWEKLRFMSEVGIDGMNEVHVPSPTIYFLDPNPLFIHSSFSFAVMTKTCSVVCSLKLRHVDLG